VIEQVSNALQAVGDPTPVLIGRKHLEQGGTSPRIVFVPEDGGGHLTSAMTLGYALAHVHSCTVNVRAIEGGNDLLRFRKVQKLTDRVAALIAVATSGRVEWGGIEDASPAKVDAFGAGLSFQFKYIRDIPHDADRWGLPPPEEDTALKAAAPPPGTRAEGVEFNPAIKPKDA